MKAPLERIRRSLPGRLVLAYFESETSNYAAGLAFNAFLTMFPIMLGIFAIFGVFLSNSQFNLDAEHLLAGVFPLDNPRAIENLLSTASHHAGTLGLVSVAALLWSGTGLFGSLEFALNHVYDVRGRNPFWQRVIGLRLIAVFVTAIVLAVVINGALAALNLGLGSILNLVAGWVVIASMLTWIYRYVPNLRLTLREVLPGALAAGALVEAVTTVFPIAFSLTHQASVYTRGFLLVVALATWLYVLSQLLLMGAVLNRLLRPVTPLSVPVPGREHPAALAVHQETEGAGI
ncbi:MAG TPA: YihY/virulence factor BrkB family protein [Candidatus Dormibacteraeota bacterium]